MLEVTLRTRSDGPRRVILRELSGTDEMLGSRSVPGAATEVLERLLVEAPGCAIGPHDAWDMSVGDRDRLIADLHAWTFADLVESRVECTSCGEGFGLSFSLRLLVKEIERDAVETAVELAIEGPDAEGFYVLPEGIRFRLPTPRDERDVSGFAPQRRGEELLRRCCSASEAALADPGARDRVERALSALAPLISLPVPTRCAICGAEQEANFDIVRYFTSTLARERMLLTREIHALARAYGWGFEEIARLPRSQRHAHVELIEAERGNLEIEA